LAFYPLNIVGPSVFKIDKYDSSEANPAGKRVYYLIIFRILTRVWIRRWKFLWKLHQRNYWG